MLKWYKNLYVGNTAKKKEKTLRRKISCGIGTFNVFVITLAVNEQNHLEIYPAAQLLQKTLRRRCPLIVGIAVGYEEAVEIVEQIVKEVWEKNRNGIHPFLDPGKSGRIDADVTTYHFNNPENSWDSDTDSAGADSPDSIFPFVCPGHLPHPRQA